jgi:hypothetical protein
VIARSWHRLRYALREWARALGEELAARRERRVRIRRLEEIFG